MMKLICKLRIHRFEHKFIPFADQPFENDPKCVTEGVHVNKCKYCGKEKKYKF